MSDYASQICNKAYDILIEGLRADFNTFRRVPMQQVQSADLPVLGVYILRETREADGNSNAGEPKFVHRLTLGFSGAVAVATDDQNALMGLEETMTKLDDLLLTNAKFISMTEGILSMDRQMQFSQAGETPLGEIRVEMVIQFRSIWPPVIVDDFKTLHVTTQFPDKAHADAGTQQIEREYDIPQT